MHGLQPIIPENMTDVYKRWKMSPAIRAGGLLFFSGLTGINRDGNLPDEPAEQMHNCFQRAQDVLNHAGLDFASLVEMTSYHIGLNEHLEMFKTIRAEYIREPYPAWTAIEVSGYVREGAIIEIRFVVLDEARV